MANLSSPENDDLSIFTHRERLVYIAVCGVTAVFAAVGNIMYLGCYLNDRNLKCCFHMFAANIAGCDLALALIITSLNAAVLFQVDYVLCAAFRTLNFFVKQETMLLLVLITFDRIQLIKGVMHYRQHVDERRYNRLVNEHVIVCTFVFFCFFLFFFLFFFECDHCQC